MATSSTMQAWRLPEFNEDPAKAIESLKLDDSVPVPQPEEGQLLLKVDCTSLNPIDWKLFTGAFQDSNPINQFPYTPGFDVAGTVLKAEALGFNMGDKVVANLGLVETVKSPSPLPNGPAGALAKFVVVPAKRCVKISKSTHFKEVAGLPLAGLTSYQALFGVARSSLNGQPLGDAKPGKKVLILNASGGTGSLAVQLAKKGGCFVAATASTNALSKGSDLTKTDLVAALGADVVIDYKNEDWGEVLNEAEYDIIFDCVGNKEDLTIRAPKVLKKGGQYVSIANFDGDAPEGINYAVFLVKSDAHDLQALVEMVEKKELVVPIDSEYDFMHVKDAFKRSLSGHATGKVLINVN